MFMGKCIKELIKEIKNLESDKQKLLSYENQNSKVTYQTSQDKIITDYDFASTRQNVKAINDTVRKYKHLINLTNSTVEVPEFGITIDACLIEMAQLNGEIAVLEHMRAQKPNSRNTTYNGAVEYTDISYSIADCEKQLKEYKDTVQAIQLAIDRINLTYPIEV